MEKLKERLEEARKEYKELGDSIDEKKNEIHYMQERMMDLWMERLKLNEMLEDKEKYYQKQRRKKLGCALAKWNEYANGYANVALNLYAFEKPFDDIEENKIYKRTLFNILKEYDAKAVVFDSHHSGNRQGGYPIVSRNIYEITEDSEMIKIYSKES